jgi:hypothetical protein
MLQHDSLRRKLEYKSLLCVLLVNLENGNYRLLELSTNKVHVSRHVVFDMNVFPARTKTSEAHRLADTKAEILSEVELSQRTTDSDGQQTHISSGITEPSEVNDADSDIAENSVYATDDESVLEDADEIADSGSDQSGPSAGSAVVEEEEDNSHSTTEPRYPSRARRPPGTWWAFQKKSKDCHLSQIQEPLVADAGQTCHVRKSIDSDEPSLKEALSSSNRYLWEASIAEELEPLRESGTWDVVGAPRGAKVFPSRFVLKVKRNSDGTFERRRARLVLQRNLQRLYVDSYDTYAPVANFVVVRIVLATAC